MYGGKTTRHMGRRNSRRRRSSGWAGLYQDMFMDDVTPVGNVPTDDTGRLDIAMATRQPIRIVHTSDTHLQHDRLLCSDPAAIIVGGGGAADTEGGLPAGDVLIHSGDFNRYKASCCVRSVHYEDLLHTMDTFFALFPHKVKFFVAGNHDACLQGVSTADIQRHLSNCVYLCDTSAQYAGLNFYGSPYTASRPTGKPDVTCVTQLRGFQSVCLDPDVLETAYFQYKEEHGTMKATLEEMLTLATGFTEPWRRLKRRWDLIPEDTDVLITHMPPLGILDLASELLPNKSPALFRLKKAILPPSTCKTCGFVHVGREHWGCPVLRDTVLNRVKPKLHLFGHVHESYGTLQRDNTVFSNGAFLLKQKYNVFDYYPEDSETV